MADWINGSVPGDGERFCWLTITRLDESYTYPEPCRYNREKKCWITFDGNKEFSAQYVSAYCPITMPKAYSVIGTGSGYYIRVSSDGGNLIVYGYGLQPVEWSGKGYATIDRARNAAKRLRRLDASDGFTDRSYEVIDSRGTAVWTLIS